MEQEVARWLASRLGYNAAADATLSANCRGNLKGLWEFVTTNYKTADSKRHIQHMLDKHRREQEAAARAPEQCREAEARRQRLHQLRKRNADLDQTLNSLQTRTEGKVQEATDQVCEQSLMLQVLQETQAQTLLLQAYTHRGQQLVPELHARLSQLRYTLDTVKARCRNASNLKAVQQQLSALSDCIKEGLHQTVWETVQQQGIPPAGPADVHCALDQQHHAPDAAAITGSQGAGPPHQQQQSSVAEALQQLMRLCKLLHSYRLPQDVLASALQLLQHSPTLLWDTCAQLARHNLLELSSHLDEAEREMLAPLHWPGSGGAGSTGQQHALVQHKPDQQQLVVYSSSGGSSGGGGKHKLPWASGLSLPCAAAMQELGISPPPEVRIKLRLQNHIQLHVRTEQTLQRAQAAERELTLLLGSTPLLQQAAAAGAPLGWEGELAQVYLNLIKARAQLALLRDCEEQFTNELLQLKEIKAITQDKDQDVKLQMEQDEELNQLLHLAALDTFELSHALLTHQSRVAQLLNLQLLPCGAAAAQAAQAAVGQQQREAVAVEKLPVLGLAEPVAVSGLQEHPGASSGQHNPVLRKPTLTRLQAAGQQLLLAGRATTGAMRSKAAAGCGGGHDVLALAAGSSDGSRRFGDRAAVAALKGAAMLDPVAPLKCPAALLLDVKGQCTEAKQLQQQLEVLSNTSMAAAAAVNAAVQQEGQLQEKVDRLHQYEREQVLPQLHALLEECQAAHVFAQDQLMSDVQQFWDIPAMHLRPKHLYQGKNCSQWLLELQQLHMQKRELSSHTGHAHMA